MVDYFDTPVAYNPDTEDLVGGAVFQVFAADDLSFSTPLAVFEVASGASLSPLASSSVGVLPQFRVAGDPTEVILKSGSFVTRVTSVYGRKGEKGDQGDPGIGVPDPSTVDDGWTLIAQGGVWIPSPGGGGGSGGREIQIGTSSTHIQWRYVGDAAWTDLVALSTLQGPQGVEGTDGLNGVNGQSAQLRVNGGYFQWKLPSDATWANLIAVTDVAPAGTIMQVTWNGVGWPSRPTVRTDVIVWWIGGSAETPPAGALASDIHWPDAA